jgi:hypothetical protein
MNRIFTVLLTLTLCSCASLIPQPSPQNLRLLDIHFTKLHSRSVEDQGPFTGPIPYHTGQYVVHGIIGPEGRKVMSIAIVGKEQGGWILETRSLTPASDSINQMLVRGLDTIAEDGSLKEIDIVWLKIMVNGQEVQRLDGTLLTMAETFIKPSLSGLVVDTQQINGGHTITTNAGTFEGTTLAQGEVSFLGRKYLSESWFHPSVPLNALVKSETEDGQIIELLDFGLQGATRSF